MGWMLAIVASVVALAALAVAVLLRIAVRLELLPQALSESSEPAHGRSLQTLVAALHRRRV
jgi:hypothetical protein